MPTIIMSPCWTSSAVAYAKGRESKVRDMKHDMANNMENIPARRMQIQLRR
jgi:hypothetical protein